MDKRIITLLMGLVMAFSMCACGGTSNDSDVPDDEPTIEETSDEPTAGMTEAQKNAYQDAINYLDFMAFSRAGLIRQLSSENGEGYDVEDAEVAVSAIEKNGGVDWVEQAKKSAKTYMSIMDFSKAELIDQLESDAGDGFTHEQAIEAVEAVYE